jgi:hypothetical protein
MSTLVGAAIGVGSTLAVERARWHRERHERARSERNRLYADYLASLSRTRNELRIAAYDVHMPHEKRGEVVRDAFKTGGVYELRYQVALVAPREVILASDTAVRALRRVRDVVAAGATHEQSPYVEARESWEVAFAELQERMRLDIGLGNIS